MDRLPRAHPTLGLEPETQARARTGNQCDLPVRRSTLKHRAMPARQDIAFYRIPRQPQAPGTSIEPLFFCLLRRQVREPRWNTPLPAPPLPIPNGRRQNRRDSVAGTRPRDKGGGQRALPGSLLRSPEHRTLPLVPGAEPDESWEQERGQPAAPRVLGFLASLKLPCLNVMATEAQSGTATEKEEKSKDVHRIQGLHLFLAVIMGRPGWREDCRRTAVSGRLRAGAGHGNGWDPGPAGTVP
uniref:Uncharacterized protein n=1 Tax=Pipistrellus kuhlii TaxID=59472 RepID=A0A7J7SG74_PIPKU|nr:hypothetical protein mPipKuh1_009975 [Pipistrellus kuhlii]